MHERNWVIKPYHQVKRLPKGNLKAATLISFLLFPLSGLITDIYLPSMPDMAVDLNQSEASIQLTLTLFLISYGLSQFISGSLLDSFGRYRLTLWSLGIFIVSCMVIACTKSITIILAMRIIQGMTTGIIVTGKRAFFVDVYTGDERKRYLSMMSIVWSSAPIIAPFIGGYLQHYFDWQANFYVLAGYGLIMLLLEWRFSGETVPQYRPLRVHQIKQDYKTMLSAKTFVLGVVVLGLAYGSTMIFNLTAPFIIEHQMHFSPVVTGYAALIMGLAWMCGGFLGKALVNRPFLPKLKIAHALQFVVILLMMLSASWHANIYTLVAFAFCVHLAVGFLFNNYLAYCMGYFPQMAGVASGLAGGGNFILTSVCSYTMVGIIQPRSQSTLGYAYLLMALLIGVILHLLLKKEPPQRQLG